MSFRERISKAAQPVDVFPELSRAQKETNRLLVAIANQIYLRRKEQKKTQAELAKQLSVTQSMICQWESGDYNFSISSLAEIFDSLGLKINLTFSAIENDGVLPQQSRYEEFETKKQRQANHVDGSPFLPEAA